MRRALDWFVVCLSLGVLLANRPWADPDRGLTPVAAAVREASRPASPFAYVREDGTQVFLPEADASLPRPPLSFEDVHADSGFASPESNRAPKAAVYTWSSPVAATTSGSPSSR